MLLQIFKKSSILLCAGTMLFFTSCSGEEIKNSDIEETVSDTPRSAPNLNTSESQIQPVQESNTQNTPLNTTIESGVTLNPPHGSPGHDCAVEVGKPLYSALDQNSPVKANSNNINPPHGAPGHDCAVAVGDPLN